MLSPPASRTVVNPRISISSAIWPPEDIPETDEKNIFSSGRRGDKPLSGFSSIKAALEEMSGVSDWGFHDIRRTASTTMRSLGIDRLIVSKVLNHAEGGATKIYDRYAADAEKAHALERWGAELARIVESKKGQKVVSIR